MLLELLELEEELLLLLELLEEDELLLELDDEELLEDELEELLVEPFPEIEPPDTVRVTRSSPAPSSRRKIRRVWLPAAKLLKVATLRVSQPLVAELFCVVQLPESSL